jgi:ATP phosphoribosyltransferase regulatory subunit
VLDQSPPTPSQTTADETVGILLGRLKAAGYDRIEPPILQDVAHFLDLGGEDIRSSLYLTTDRTGAELCLRPEYTIPVCRAYLTSPEVGQPAAFAYCGPVFRFGGGGSGEFVQAGLENYGRTDVAAADAEILSLSLEAVHAAGGRELSVRFGDAGLLHALLDALQLPLNWQRRLKRGLDKGADLDTVLAEAPGGAAAHDGVLGALAGVDEKGARALVTDLLAIAGIASVGGRTSAEIAERFLAQVALRTAPPFGAEQRAVLRRFLAVSGDPDEAGAALRALAADAALDLARDLDLFDERASFLAADGVDFARLTFGAAFARNLDYYSGFVFEARTAGTHDGPIIGGGRYDRLTQALGGPSIPAVGAAIWPARITQAAKTL